MRTDRRAFTRTLLGGAGAAMVGTRDAGAGPPTRGFGLDLGSVDPQIAPGDDFFRHVNGGWLRTTQIPADRPAWNEFTRLAELNAQRAHALLKDAAVRPGSPAARKLGDLYASLMDEAAIERAGLAPIEAELKRIAAIAGPANLARAVAGLGRDWWSRPRFGDFMRIAPLNIGVLADLKAPTRYVATVTQGGLGVPDRDYLLGDGESFARVRSAYQAHIATLFALSGMDQPEARAARAYALEVRLAKAHWSRVQLRNVLARYNVWRREDFAEKAPGLDWDAFLAAAGVADQSRFLVGEPSSVVATAAALGEAPLQDWRDYLSARVLRVFAPMGPRRFVEAEFEFTGRVLTGTPQLAERWKRAGQAVDLAMGPVLGELYMTRYFPPHARAEAERMTREIKAAMGRRIAGLDWMAPETKAKALAKLAAVRIEVGGETPLPTLESLQVCRDDGYGNLLRASQLAYARELAKLSRPVNRGEWSMLPHTINAQSNPLLVKIMFPAGIMQGLFFDPAADAAVNYGAVGVVMGHELSHIFDDQGALFDEHGALHNWWTPADYRAFSQRTAALAAQYDGYRPLPDMPIKGRLTLGENIGDLAGLALALDAYRASLGGRAAPKLGGFTGEQRFFMAYAQTWRGLQREEALRQQLASDPHAPAAWRVMTVRNVDAWYDAFDVRPNQAMYLAPEDRIRVW